MLGFYSAQYDVVVVELLYSSHLIDKNILERLGVQYKVSPIASDSFLKLRLKLLVLNFVWYLPISKNANNSRL